jgi:hypothetical protein
LYLSVELSLFSSRIASPWLFTYWLSTGREQHQRVNGTMTINARLQTHLYILKKAV